MDSLNFNSVETLPNLSARAAFQVNSSAVFKEDVDIVPVIIDDTLSYMPWGGDNNMPFDILKLIEDDETLSTCQMFNAEVCFGSGLRYDTCLATAAVKSEVEDFFLDNDIASYYLGVCQDFKHFGFAVSVIILSRDGTKIVRLLRKEACYCRFAPAGKDGRITRLLYANWRKCIASRSDIEVIEILDRLLHGETCKIGSPRIQLAASLPLSAVFLRLTALIIPFLITLRFSKGNGIISSNSSDLPRSRNSATPHLSSIKSRFPKSIGNRFSAVRASPTAASSRNASCRRSRAFSTSSPGRRTAAKPGSPRST